MGTRDKNQADKLHADARQQENYPGSSRRKKTDRREHNSASRKQQQKPKWFHEYSPKVRSRIAPLRPFVYIKKTYATHPNTASQDEDPDLGWLPDSANGNDSALCQIHSGLFETSISIITTLHFTNSTYFLNVAGISAP
jgi:hypothetical protein